MSELDFSRMISFNAESDKNTTLQIGVYMGYASITVWSNRNQVVRIPTSRTLLVQMRKYFQKILSSKPSEKVSISFSRWDLDTKKSVSIGVVYIGRDDKSTIYIGIQAPGHSPMKFPIKSSLSFDTSEPMSDVERSELETESLIERLTTDIPVAMVQTSYKRNMPQKEETSSKVNKKEETSSKVNTDFLTF